MSFIPICGVATSRGEIHATIILAGDTEQMRPIVNSMKAEKLGANISFMENLCNQPLYSQKKITRSYNEAVCVQLTGNYRSHESIIQIPNSLFYNGTLVAKADKYETEWFCHTGILPSPTFPIIFHSVEGQCTTSDLGYQNDDEIEIIIKYLAKLVNQEFDGRKVQEDDIAILTPYTQQKRALKKCLNFPVTVATVAEFQGREKPIILLSMVRDHENMLGITEDPKLFNTAITRAKSLLIVVGNANVLAHTTFWDEFIAFCKSNNSFVTQM